MSDQPRIQLCPELRQVTDRALVTTRAFLALYVDKSPVQLAWLSGRTFTVQPAERSDGQVYLTLQEVPCVDR